MAKKARYGITQEAKKRPINPHPVVLDLLEYVYEHEPVRTSHLYAVMPHRLPNSISASLGILHKCAAITKEGDDLENLVRPLDHYSSDIIWLTEKGEKFLLNYRQPYKVVNVYRPRGDFALEREHKLGISDTLANLRAGAIKHGVRFIPQGEIEWDMGKDDSRPLSLPAKVSTLINQRQLTWEGQVTPDGLFGLEYEDGTRKYVALEYQRAGKVEPNKLYGVSSMRRKYLAYADIHRTKVFKNKWGLRNLSVLFVFSHGQKYDQSIRLAETLFPDGAPMFLHHYAPEFSITANGYIQDPDVDINLITRPLGRAGCDALALYHP